MSEAASFTMVCGEIESRTSLDRLEARGTVRLALKEAGLEATSVTPDQMKVVLSKILPGALTSRGVEDGPTLCRDLAGMVAGIVEQGGDAPDQVFARLGG